MVMCVHLYGHFVNRDLKTSRWRATLNQFDNPPLRVGMGFDVALGGRERCMSGQKLHVPQRAANRADLPRGVGDESAPAAVARAAVEAQGPIPDGEQVHDRRRRSSAWLFPS